MTLTNPKALFDAIREVKGSALSQSDVARINRALAEAMDEGGMAPSPAIIARMREFEGYHKALPDGRVQAYPDPASGGDPWTIGHGSTGPDIKRGTVWTREQAERRFAEDVAKFARGVEQLVNGAATTPAEFDALVSFAYNVGLNALRKSTLLKKHLAGDKEGAAKEFGRWVNAAGKRMPGLVKRRAAEADHYRGRA